MNKKLQELNREAQCAIQNVMACISDAETASTAIRIGEVNSLHVAAFMDIDKTTDALKPILEYRKKASEQLLRTTNESQIKALKQLLIHAEDMINKVLGIYAP